MLKSERLATPIITAGIQMHSMESPENNWQLLGSRWTAMQDISKTDPFHCGCIGNCVGRYRSQQKHQAHSRAHLEYTECTDGTSNVKLSETTVATQANRWYITWISIMLGYKTTQSRSEGVGLPFFSPFFPSFLFLDFQLNRENSSHRKLILSPKPRDQVQIISILQLHSFSSVYFSRFP